MSTTVKTGWLNDKNGDKFAPKTLTSQIQTNDGVLLEDYINTKTEKLSEAIEKKIESPDTARVGQMIRVLEVDENGRATAVEAVDFVKSDWNQNDETSDDYVKNRTHYDTRVTEIVTCTFDGNFDAWTGEKVDLNSNGTMYYLKLSDDVPSLTDFVGCTQIAVDDGVLTSTTITEDSTDWYADTGHGIYVTIAFVLVTEVVDDYPMAPGIWAMCKLVDGVLATYTVQASYKKVIGELKKIDKKYLPEYTTDEEVIEMLIETDMLPATTTASGAILTDQNGNVILRY